MKFILPSYTHTSINIHKIYIAPHFEYAALRKMGIILIKWVWPKSFHRNILKVLDLPLGVVTTYKFYYIVRDITKPGNWDQKVKFFKLRCYGNERIIIYR